MVYIVGAGSGAADLITVRGARLLGQADVIIYAGSLVNPEVLLLCQKRLPDPQQRQDDTGRGGGSDGQRPLPAGKTWSGCTPATPAIYGAIREQMDALDQQDIPYEVVPGVSSFCGAAAALQRGIHPARRQPDGDHHPDGGPHAGARAGEHPLAGIPRRHHGHFPLGRAAAPAGAGSGGRGL